MTRAQIEDRDSYQEDPSILPDVVVLARKRYDNDRDTAIQLNQSCNCISDNGKPTAIVGTLGGFAQRQSAYAFSVLFLKVPTKGLMRLQIARRIAT